MENAQKAAVERYHQEGMNRRSVEAVTGLMTDDVGWFSVDADFARRWYRGKREIGDFLAAMFEHTAEFEFSLKRLIADPEVPDAVVAEWTNRARMEDGSSYRNMGCTIFEFAPGSDRISGVLQYFDWGPLMERGDWRQSVRGAGA